VDQTDTSNGWEGIAPAFIADRDRSTIGVATVRAWARAFPPGAAVLDLGCGPGGPRSRALFDAGLAVFAVDAAPSFTDAYRSRFPSAHVACEPVETSPFFGRSFQGAVAWGLLFLLSTDAQRRVIPRIATALRPGGRFLFTAPAQACTWADLSTGRESRSLGAPAYRALLEDAGLTVVAEYADEGENHYYDAIRGRA
jgi:SAM-dependent methyltransferase